MENNYIMDNYYRVETEKLEFRLDENYDYTAKWVKPINYIMGHSSITMNKQIWAVQISGTGSWFLTVDDCDISIEETHDFVIVKVHDPGIFDKEADFVMIYRCFIN